MTLRPRWYWFRFRSGFRVTFHLKTDHVVRWTHIYGVQIGGWFIGAVKSGPVESHLSADAVDPHASSTGTLTTRDKEFSGRRGA